MKHIWIDGRVLPENEVSFSTYDLGLVRGFGVCDFLSIVDGTPLFAGDHIDRFLNSQKHIGITPKYSHGEIKQAILDTISTNDTDACNSIRLIATGGHSETGIDIPENPTTMVHPLPNKPLEDSLIENGIAVMTHAHQREFHKAKTMAYATRLILEPQLKEGCFDEVIYHNGTHALEASTSNLFIIKNGEIYTPKENILHGITRKKIIESVSSQHKIHEQKIPLQNLYEADEVFITATNKSIIPVLRIDDTLIGNGKPGQITKSIIDIFSTFKKEYLASQK